MGSCRQQADKIAGLRLYVRWQIGIGACRSLFLFFEIFLGSVLFAPVEAIPSAVGGDLGEQQFGGKAAFRQVSGDFLSCSFGVYFRIQKSQDRRTRATQGGAKDSGFASQLLDRGQQRTKRSAVGLVDAIFERGGEKFAFVVYERCQQKHRILDVGDGVGACVLKWQYTARLFGGEGRVRDREQQRPTASRFDLDHLRLDLVCHASDGYSSHPTGGGIVGMMFAHGSFSDNAVGFPAEMSVMNGERDAGEAGGGGRAASFGDGNFVLDVDAEGDDFTILGLKDFTVSSEDEVIVHAAADMRVAALGGNEKVGSAFGVQAQVEVHR